MIMYICIKRGWGATMNYVRTILIGIALLNMHHTYNGQILPNTSDSQTEPTFDTIESLLESIPVVEPSAETKKTNDLQAWNDHLTLLTNNDEYWDATINNPTDEWKNKAFNLAEEVLKQDKSLAETLKTDFINALNKKTTKFLDINSLVTEFSNFIDLLSASEVSQESKGLIPPSPIVPEITTSYVSEPITETAPLQTISSETTTSSSSEEKTTSSSINEQNDQEPNEDQLKQTWSEQLEKIKTEGENWVQIDDILNKTYEAAKELLKSGKIKEDKLQQGFRAALAERSVREKIKPLYHLNIDDTLYYFNNSIGSFSAQPQAQFNEPYRFPEPSAFEPISPDQPQKGILDARNKKRDEEFEKLKKEYAAKDVKFKEFEKEQQKAKEERMIALKASQEAQEKGALAQKQVYKLAEAQKKLEKEYEEKRKQDRKDIEEARKSLMNYTEQIAANQKAAAGKGLLSTFTDTLSNWWYGTSSEKTEELSSIKEDDLLAMMVKDVPHYLQQAAKKTFKDFQNTLLGFNNPQFWNDQKSIPNIAWIARMDELIKDVAITYKLMNATEISAFVQNILQKSDKISPSALTSIMSKIQAKTNQALAQEKLQQEAVQQKEQRKKEKKEQKILEEQRIKAEKERSQAEKQRQIASTHTYKTEKKQWYDLLDKVAQHKQATPQENHAHLQRALEKSQSLLQLAGNIPAKDKTKLSQKLKQKFSIALLNQQKNSDQNTNVYHHMDLFNKEVNKMID